MFGHILQGVISPSDNLGEASASSGFVFGESLSARAVTEANGSSESSHKDDSDSDSGKPSMLVFRHCPCASCWEPAWFGLVTCIVIPCFPPMLYYALLIVYENYA